VATGWADWKFRNSVPGGRERVAVAHIFAAPPVTTTLADTLAYAVAFNVDTDARRSSPPTRCTPKARCRS
jgi:feruloyl esterase